MLLAQVQGGGESGFRVGLGGVDGFCCGEGAEERGGVDGFEAGAREGIAACACLLFERGESVSFGCGRVRMYARTFIPRNTDRL